MPSGGARPGAGRKPGTKDAKPRKKPVKRQTKSADAIKNNAVKVFAVNGANKNFADIILENSSIGGTCVVASYGFGVKQVERLVSYFKEVTLIADESHSQLNPNAYEHIVKLSDNGGNGFTFKPTKTHAKMAIINNETLIFTSANLSSNRMVEIYLITSVSSVDGVDGILRVFGDPDGMLDGEFDLDEKDSQGIKSIDPIDFMLSIMNDPKQPPDRRDKMAIAAAPFIHRKASDKSGVKEDRAEAAAKAAKGKFQPGAPPVKLISIAGSK